MRRRVFIAIPISEEAKKVISKEVEKIRGLFSESFLDIRFIEPKNWHLTVIFLAYQEDDDLVKIIKVAEEAASKFSSLKLEFEKIVYGPNERAPRMIWAVGNKSSSQAIGEVKKFLEQGLLDEGVNLSLEDKSYKMHLTLARFNSAKREDLPSVERNLEVSYEANQIQVVESELNSMGAEYTVLGEFEFRG